MRSLLRADAQWTELPFFQIEMPADGPQPLRTSLVVNFGTSIRGHVTRSA
jgi:hypothetical protein